MEESFFGNPETWVAVSFLIFLGGLIYLKVPGLLTRTLDERTAKIKTEIDRAAALKAEAEATVAKYRELTRNADKEAEQIIVDAKHLADLYDAKAKQDLEILLARRVQLGKEKIARAEVEALAEVRRVAAETAVAAARALIAERLDAGTKAMLVDQTIGSLASARLN